MRLRILRLAALTFNLECRRFFHFSDLKRNSPSILRSQVLQRELVNSTFVTDSVYFIGEEDLSIQKPLGLFICIINLSRESCVTILVNFYVSQVLGDLNFTNWRNKNGLF